MEAAVPRDDAVHDQALVTQLDDIARNGDQPLDQPHVVARRSKRHDVAATWLAEGDQHDVGERDLEVVGEPVDEHDVAFEQRRPHRAGRNRVPVGHR